MAQKRALRQELQILKNRERLQEESAQKVRRRNRWGMLLGMIVIIILLLGIIMLYHHLNGQDATSRTSQLTPSGTQSTTSTTSGAPRTSTQGANTVTRETTVTNNTKETTNNTVTNNTSTSSNTNQSVLDDLLATIHVGDTLDSVKAEASKLGIQISCNTETAPSGSQLCVLASGDKKVTITSLLSNNLITVIVR